MAARRSWTEISTEKPRVPHRDRLKTLVEHCGGLSGLERLLGDFYSRMARDILVGFFFDRKNVAKIAQNQARLIAKAADLSPTYDGKAPHSAHIELPPILRGHFDRRLQILRETMAEHGLAAEDMRTWIEFENAFRDAVISPLS